MENHAHLFRYQETSAISDVSKHRQQTRCLGWLTVRLLRCAASLTCLTYLACVPYSIAPAVAQPNPIPIRIQDLERTNDPIATYIVEILRLAIQKSGAHYVIVKSTDPTVPQARQIFDLAQNQGKLDVIWTMTSDDREAQLRAIKIPIDKGFFGWRIPFIHGDQPNLLSSVKTMKDLAQFRAGQGTQWPDTDILRRNGLPVVTGSDESLTSMLSAKRFDYFPRPIIAIWNEHKNVEYRHFLIDKTFVLHYPTAFYFFVAPKQKQLADDLTRGLEKAVEDGSFEKVFNKYFSEFIRAADLKHRVIFELKNPLIKKGSLPSNPKFWFKPQ